LGFTCPGGPCGPDGPWNIKTDAMEATYVDGIG